MSKMLDKLKESWMWIVGIIGLALLAMRAKDKYDTALSNEKLTDSKVKSKEIETKVKANKGKVLSLDLKRQQLKKKAKKKTKKQVEDFYND